MPIHKITASAGIINVSSHFCTFEGTDIPETDFQGICLLSLPHGMVSLFLQFFQ